GSLPQRAQQHIPLQHRRLMEPRHQHLLLLRHYLHQKDPKAAAASQTTLGVHQQTWSDMFRLAPWPLPSAAWPCF
ncbi:hypothetical protein LPJ59_003414, partial [Coemansia sp. RSA 2399]